LEQIIFSLISYSGEAKSYCMEAMALARAGQFKEAHEKIELAEECLLKAHQSQTSLIQNEAAGEKTEISLLLIHAQDHLMNTLTIKALAQEIMALSKMILEKQS